ncbi:glycerophosphodiester phosphodiesterase [Kurthia senegalensis]|uniref:glycerophosphodiester phosphodiesterase n=1 Tax=Kurthia senegalensis TaxID=1033740 RepID=UPI00028962E3|nr:glycerophosphodiester phosphodiesterase family protein [Kurthia senegalensis]
MSNLAIYAHRGVLTNAPENSMRAFEDAMKEGATGIEFDLQLTRDKVAIVTHDLNVERLTKKDALLTDLTFNQVRKLKVKQPKQKAVNLLSFDTLLKWLVKENIPVNIELKESFIGDVASIESVVKKCELLSSVHISSFHDEILRVVKWINPTLETAFIPTKKFDWQTLGTLDHIDVIHANKNYYFKQMYWDELKKANKKIRYYNVLGTEEDLQQVPQEIIGWITDFPKRVAEKQRG